MGYSKDQPDQPLRGSASEAVTNSVRVEVEACVPEKSQPFESEWVFAYTVRITNEGDETVQLLSRHWIITDASGHVEEVRGPGVIGEQPVLAPGESFITSWCPLKTSSGVMHGTYQMLSRTATTSTSRLRPSPSRNPIPFTNSVRSGEIQPVGSCCQPLAYQRDGRSPAIAIVCKTSVKTDNPEEVAVSRRTFCKIAECLLHYRWLGQRSCVPAGKDLRT
jgi:ApaG protein